MKKTLIAAALLATFGATQAQVVVVGDTTDASIVQVGASNVNAGPHVAGKPGVGVDGTNIIDLAGIDSFSYVDSATAPSSVPFRRYQLLGYSHTPSGGTPVTTNFNWFKVPTISQQVYFGIATNPAAGGSARADAAFAVGDQAGFSVPTSATNYATAGLLVPGTNYAGTTPVILTGTLNLTISGGTTTLAGSLAGGSDSLAITAGVNTSAGTFSGTSSYAGSGVSGAGTTNGHFYGSGSTSAVAGVAKSGSGSGTSYVAAFGGIKN